MRRIRDELEDGLILALWALWPFIALVDAFIIYDLLH